MADFDQRVSDPVWIQTQTQMQDLAIRLAKDFGLEATLDLVVGRHKTALTPGAMLTLVVPLVEAAGAQYYRHREGMYDPRLDATLDVVEGSVDSLVADMKGDPAAADRVAQQLLPIDDERRRYPMRSSLSAVKAISKRFCRIPPFCGE